MFMVFSATFNNISVISWLSVLLVNWEVNKTDDYNFNICILYVCSNIKVSHMHVEYIC